MHLSFYSYHGYGVLHSFPTRRSSDLFVVFYLLSGVAAAATQIIVDTGSRIPMVGASGAISGVMRSEEHTSELQSHSELVCRLLLEKKKNRFHNRFHH